MRMDKHINKIRSKVVALRRFDGSLHKAEKTIYYSHIITHISYYITAWCQCSATNKLIMSRLRRKALKELYGYQNRRATVRV